MPLSTSFRQILTHASVLALASTVLTSGALADKLEKPEILKPKIEKPEKVVIEKIRLEKPEKITVEKIKPEKPEKIVVEKIKPEKPGKIVVEKIKPEKPQVGKIETTGIEKPAKPDLAKPGIAKINTASGEAGKSDDKPWVRVDAREETEVGAVPNAAAARLSRQDAGAGKPEVNGKLVDPLKAKLGNDLDALRERSRDMADAGKLDDVARQIGRIPGVDMNPFKPGEQGLPDRNARRFGQVPDGSGGLDGGLSRYSVGDVSEAGGQGWTSYQEGYQGRRGREDASRSKDANPAPESDVEKTFYKNDDGSSVVRMVTRDPNSGMTQHTRVERDATGRITSLGYLSRAGNSTTVDAYRANPDGTVTSSYYQDGRLVQETTSSEPREIVDELTTRPRQGRRHDCGDLDCGDTGSRENAAAAFRAMGLKPLPGTETESPAQQAARAIAETRQGRPAEAAQQGGAVSLEISARDLVTNPGFEAAGGRERTEYRNPIQVDPARP